MIKLMLPALIFCFLTINKLFSQIEPVYSTTTLLSNKGRIVTIRPLGDKYAVLSVKDTISELAIYTNDHKLVVAFRDDDPVFRGSKLTNSYFEDVDPQIYISFDENYLMFNTWSQTRTVPMESIKDQNFQNVNDYQDIFKYEFSTKKLVRVIGVGDSVQVINDISDFRPASNIGVISLISPGFPGDDADYVLMQMKSNVRGSSSNDGSIVMSGIFKIQQGQVRLLLNEFKATTNVDYINRNGAPIKFGDYIYYDSIKHYMTLYLVKSRLSGDMIQVALFGNVDGSMHSTLPDYLSNSLFSTTFSTAHKIAPVKDLMPIKVFDHKKRFRTFFSLNDGIGYSVDRDTGYTDINTNTGINVTVGGVSYPIVTKDTRLAGVPIGANIGDRLASMGCSVLAIKKDEKKGVGQGNDVLVEAKASVMTGYVLNGIRLTLNGCFHGAEKGNVEIQVNGNPFVPENPEISERKITFNLPPHIVGKNKLRVVVKRKDGLLTGTVNTVEVDIPIIPLKFELDKYFVEPRPGEDVVVKATSNLPGTLEIISDDNNRQNSTSNFSNSGEYKFDEIIKDTKFTFRFKAVNGLEEVIELVTKVLPPQVNDIFTGKDDYGNNLLIHPLSVVALSGNNLSYDGEEHKNEDNSALPETGTKILVNGKTAKIIFISESYLIFEIPETETGENWIQVFVNGKGTAIKIIVSEKINMRNR